MADLRYLTLGGTGVVSGSLGNLFAVCRVGDAASIAYVQVVNATGATLSNLRVYLRLDSGGVACTIAVADGTSRAESYAYPTPTPPGSWSAPTTYAAGLAIPTSGGLASGNKVLIAIKRDPTTGSAADVESNVLVISTS